MKLELYALGYLDLAKVMVHRKRATRAFPKEMQEIPEMYRDLGQPVVLPGSMGTATWVLLVGKKSMELIFGSTAHGAGRIMSRTASSKASLPKR